jgi:formylmethanofuran dehydrogenase subunit E
MPVIDCIRCGRLDEVTDDKILCNKCSLKFAVCNQCGEIGIIRQGNKIDDEWICKECSIHDNFGENYDYDYEDAPSIEDIKHLDDLNSNNKPFITGDF